jgi:predicted membrane-bound spermidine synthase
MTRILCTLFFLSGAAALLFETLWFHQAGLTFGNSVWASAIVLSSFMVGLALGNGLMARFGARIRRPVRFYALLEAVIGVFGVALVFILPAASAWLAPVFRPFLDQPLILNPLRLGIGFLLMLPPATAMGATLPVLVKALLARDPNFGSVLGRLYGWNTLGAVVGAVAGEAALVEWFGIRGTAMVAGALDGVAVVAAMALSIRLTPAGEAAFAAPVEPARARITLPARRCLVAAFFAGGTLLGYEVVWFRFMHLFVHSGGLVFSLMLAVVLAGIGLGGFAGGFWLRRDPGAFRRAPALALLSGALSAALYFGFSFAIAPYTESLIADPGPVLRLSFVLMFPISFLSGILFTFIGSALHQEVAPETRATGLLTLANTLGGALGSALGGFVLLPMLGMESSFFALGVSYGLVGLLLWGVRAAGAPTARSPLPYAFGGLFVVAMAFFPFGLMESDYLRISIERWDEKHEKEIVAVREGRIETIVYLEKELDGEPVSHQLLTNGFSMSATSSFGRRFMRLYVFWPVALRADPKRALVISFGAGSTVKGLVETRSVEHIDVVDISRAILELSDLVYPDPDEHPLNDPRVHVHIEDGRYFLQATDGRYDIITADPPPPKNAGVVNLYTQEYFQLIYDRLNEGGITTYWLPAHNTLESDAKAIIRGFCEVFEDCSLWAGYDADWMLAGSRNAKWARSEAGFVRQWQDPEPAKELRAVGIEKPEQLGAMFMADAEQLRGLVGDTPPLTDNYPKRLSNERHSPQIARVTYRSWMNADLTRERFQSSEFIRRAWPEGLRERSLAYFDFQDAINDIAARRRFVLPARIERLHEILTESDLETLVIWQLGSTADELEAVDRLLAQGKPRYRYRRHLTKRAFAERNYDLAARYLKTKPGKPIRDVTGFYLRMYALCMAGKVSEAEKAVRETRQFLPDDAEGRQYFAWLKETFGFEPPTPARAPGRAR